MYMSPEQWGDSAAVDLRADIYCLGAVAYFLLTGRPPFTSSSPVQLLYDHVRATPHPPSEVAETPIPPELDRIVMKCLEKGPEDRFVAVDDLELALSEIHFEEPWTREKARVWWELHQPVRGEVVAG